MNKMKITIGTTSKLKIRALDKDIFIKITKTIKDLF